MKITELIEQAGGGQVTARFIRFLISEGIIDPPTGGRARADYNEAHVRGVVNYLRLRELGLSLRQVKEIFRSERGETIPFEIASGLSLHVDLGRLERSTMPAEVAERVRQILTEILAALSVKGNDNDDDA